MQSAGAFLLPRQQSLPQPGIAIRYFKKSIHQRAVIESRAAHYDWQPAPPRNFRKHAARALHVIAGCENCLRLHDVDEVVRNPAPFLDRRFRRTDVEVPVHLNGIAIDDLAVQPGRKIERQIALAGSRRSQDREKRTKIHANSIQLWDADTIGQACPTSSSAMSRSRSS